MIFGKLAFALALLIASLYMATQDYEYVQFLTDATQNVHEDSFVLGHSECKKEGLALYGVDTNVHHLLSMKARLCSKRDRIMKTLRGQEVIVMRSASYSGVRTSSRIIIDIDKSIKNTIYTSVIILIAHLVMAFSGAYLMFKYIRDLGSPRKE